MPVQRIDVIVDFLERIKNMLSINFFTNQRVLNNRAIVGYLHSGIIRGFFIIKLI